MQVENKDNEEATNEEHVLGSDLLSDIMNIYASSSSDSNS